MNNQTTNAPISFIVTATYWQSASEMRKDLYEWLATKNSTGQALPTVEETEPAEISKYVEREERAKVATLLFDYGNSSYGYQNLLHLLYDFFNERDNDDIQSGLWDFYSFLQNLTEFFLIPKNTKAYAKDGRGTKTISTYLPRLMDTISNIAHSPFAHAVLDGVSLTYGTNSDRKEVTEMVESYGLSMPATIEVKQAA